jgi:putative hemolysin
MTPRVKIDALSSKATIKEALDFYLKHTHSRIPVYTKTIDKIDYFITARDLICQLNN